MLTLAEQLSLAYETEAWFALERYPIDMDLWHVSFQTRSGHTAGRVEAYVSADEIREWGKQLESFGTGIEDEATLDLGGGPGYWPHTLVVRALIRDRKGNAAIEFEANDVSPPHGAATRLFIHCEVAAVNRLGRAVQSWSIDGAAPLVWTPAP